MNCLKTVFYLLVALMNNALFLPLSSKIILLVPMCVFYVLVNSKTAHPPPPSWANPGAFDFFEKFWSNSPLCCCFHSQMPLPLELQRESNQPPCHAMRS